MSATDYADSTIDLGKVSPFRPASRDDAGISTYLPNCNRVVHTKSHACNSLKRSCLPIKCGAITVCSAAKDSLLQGVIVGRLAPCKGAVVEVAVQEDVF